MVAGEGVAGCFLGSSDERNDDRFLFAADFDENGIKRRPNACMPLNVDRVFSIIASVPSPAFCSILVGEGHRKKPPDESVVPIPKSDWGIREPAADSVATFFVRPNGHSDFVKEVCWADAVQANRSQQQIPRGIIWFMVEVPPIMLAREDASANYSARWRR